MVKGHDWPELSMIATFQVEICGAGSNWVRAEFMLWSTAWYPGEPSVIDVFFQWPFQEPKLEVPTIYKAYKAVYIRPKFQGISPQNMVLYGTVPPF